MDTSNDEASAYLRGVDDGRAEERAGQLGALCWGILIGAAGVSLIHFGFALL